MFRRRTSEPPITRSRSSTIGNAMQSEKSPPLSPSRTKALTRSSTSRVLLIFAVIASLIVVSRLITPDTSHTSFLPGSSTHLLHKHELVPRDYLNASNSDPAPFDFCPHYGPGDAVAATYGAHNLAKSRVNMGSGVRIQKVIHRALSGLPITVSVLGGSVSACHGAGDDPISPNCYPSRFFEWWNTVFPHPASELTNGAMRKTDSAYFSFCHGHHLPDQTDLVILEFDADDPNDPEWLNHFDLLVRSILQRPDQPAILILGHFAPQMHEAYGSNDPSHLHSLVARFYDVPMLSTRGVIFNDYMSNPAAKKKTYWIDPILANGAGHALLADVMISYFQEMICKGWDAALGRGFDVPVLSTAAMNAPGAGGLFGGAGIRKGAPGEAVANENEAAAKAGLTDPSMQAWSMLRVPPIRINDREPAPGRYMREPVPFCASANDLINPLPPSLFYGSGWHARNPGTSRSDAAGSLNYYWYSTIPMSKLRVPVKLHAGDVAIYYLLEPEKNFPKGGAGVLCWVDDNVAGAVEISGVADINSPVPALMIIDRSVDPGSHYVECQLMGEEGESSPAFKILGIFAT